MTIDARSLQRILLVVIVILSLVLGGGLLLPGASLVEREAVIAAPPSAVYKPIVTLRQWHEWSVVHALPPDTPVEYSGKETGAGATRRWNSPDGRGVMKIMDTQRDRQMEYELLLDGGARTMTGKIRLRPEGQGTHVMWQVGLAAGANPLERYAALFDRFVLGQDLETSLVRLKARVETPR